MLKRFMPIPAMLISALCAASIFACGGGTEKTSDGMSSPLGLDEDALETEAELASNAVDYSELDVLSDGGAGAQSGGNSLKVFILAGQSNMEGQGVVEKEQKYIDKNGGMGTLSYMVRNSAGKSEYRHLIDSSGNWSSRSDVWLVELTNSGPLTVKGRRFIGPETQFGHVIGNYYENSNVLIIKTAWGGKSLYADFRPPSSSGAVGPYYTEMINTVHKVLNNIKDYYPGYNGQGYEIVGFGWHQGWNDRVNDAAVAEYQENCVNLINDLRKEFDLPEMPFVLATTGMTGWSEDSARGLALMNAQLAVPSDSRLNVKKNTFAVETRDFWRDETVSPSGFGFHWNNNAETYFLIGNGMGNAMIQLLSGRDRSVVIKALVNNKYVCATDGGNSALWANKTAVEACASFYLTNNNDGTISLKSEINGKFVSADKVDYYKLIANKTSITGDTEKFNLSKNSNGKFSLKSKENTKYVRATYVGKRALKAINTIIGPAEQYTIIDAK
jgi:alpha-galactosidase